MERQSPLAALLRPHSLESFIGQKHLLAPKKPLWQALTSGTPHSMIFWGPPGCGKTTLAQMMAQAAKRDFVTLSAVTTAVKEMREVLEQGRQSPIVLFLDEVHRLNKAQQDLFLPYIEEGSVIFIGATTENPSFELNRALLSRARVYVFKALEIADLLTIIEQAQYYLHKNGDPLILTDAQKAQLAEAAQGDARRLLNYLEILSTHTQNTEEPASDDLIEQTLEGAAFQFDKKGEHFFDQISALHKSVRGSSPDAALYWLARMIKGGVDPLYIARRVVRMASEDIGNADLQALTLALHAWDVQERLGSPEGELALAQAVTYMAVAPKSNAIYTAWSKAQQDAERHPAEPVPLHLRNAPTKLMKSLDYGKAYRYDHDEPNAFAAGQTYFPEKMGERRYYQPVNRGLEMKIQEKLKRLKELAEQSS